jgi:nucleoside-diphosphate-sugar epimerase
MTILIVGATGATGKPLVDQLLSAGHRVKVIVRSTNNVPSGWIENKDLVIIQKTISEIDAEELARHLVDCDAVGSCLGHTPNLKGIYGKPRKLVTNAIRMLCEAIILNKPEKPVKLVLMNTVGNRNRDLNEPRSFGERMVTGLLRLLVPPHPDNEKAADYLRVNIGQKNQYAEWAAVRPYNLINHEHVSEYSLAASPIGSAIFDSRKTSRINVSHFMAALMTNESDWKKWKGQMPVIYNTVEQSGMNN